MPDDDLAAAAADLRKKRRAALLARWSAAKPLKPEELEEIEDLIPRPPPAVQVLELEAQVVGANDKKYLEGREAYAGRYGQSIRTINRWMKKGAPMDRPGEMPGWWSANMKHRVPAEILAAAAAGDAVPAEAEAASSSRGGSDAVQVAQLSPLDQARAVANEAYAKLQTALAGPDQGAIALAQRSYQQASEQLRRMELADPKIRMAAGKTVDREKLRVKLTELHTSIVQTWRSFCKRMRRELMGKTAAEQETLWQEETDKVFERFRNFEFADPVS